MFCSISVIQGIDWPCWYQKYFYFYIMEFVQRILTLIKTSITTAADDIQKKKLFFQIK